MSREWVVTVTRGEGSETEQMSETFVMKSDALDWQERKRKEGWTITSPRLIGDLVPELTAKDVQP